MAALFPAWLIINGHLGNAETALIFAIAFLIGYVCS
jgi:hypothetical protein